jgi:hypothetical protein
MATALLAMLTIPVFAQPPSAQNQAAERQRLQDQTPDTPGTGRYPAIKQIDPRLPGHVVYRPADLGALGDTKLGLYVFGNGACSDDGASARLHLLEIASHGYLAIAPGAIYNGPGKSERPQRPASPSSPQRVPNSSSRRSTGRSRSTLGTAAPTSGASTPARSRSPGSAAAVCKR